VKSSVPDQQWDATGAVLCVAGMSVLGASVSLSRLILDYPTLVGQAMRYAVAAGILTALRPALMRPTRAEFGRLVLLAATGMAGFNVCVLAALRHADAALVGTIIGAAPLGIAVVGPLLRHSRPTPRLVAASAVVVGGAALVHGGGHADGLGLLAALGAFVGEVCFSLLAASVLPRLGAVQVTTWACALSVPMLVLPAVPLGELDRMRLPTAAEAGTLAYLAVVLTVGVFLAWYTGIARLGVEKAGMFVGLLPVTTLVTACLQDGVLPQPAQAAGVLVVALGLAVGLTARTARRAPQPATLAKSSY
jgi:drug/metabolite transporter (DMT)-like permease